MSEDGLLEGDQSDISTYRIVFYAEVFIMVKNESASCYYALALASVYHESLYAEMYL